MARIFIVLSFVTVLYSISIFAQRVMTAWHGVEGSKSWGELCQIEDCSQFPALHMTYEIDGKRYYFPAAALSTDPAIDYVPTFAGVLPIGHKRSESRFRRTIQVGRSCCIGWGPLDFDFYLETRADNAILRGFGRINETTDTIRFSRGVLGRLPEYYDIDTTHPSGRLRDFSFYLHSHNSTQHYFRLSSRLHALVSRIGKHLPQSEKLALLRPFRSGDDLASAGFQSLNDAFWIVSDRRHAEYAGLYAFNGIAVVSKSPMLLGRYVYGHCNSRCQFTSLRFADDPPNDELLLKVDMMGDDINVLLRPCVTTSEDSSCDHEQLNFANMRLRFEMVEQVIEALRKPPTALAQ